MKLRLTQPGWERYTGQMGVIQFVDGLSDNDVLPIDAVRMGAVMGCEWEDGKTSNVAQRLLDESGTPAPDLELQRQVEIERAIELTPPPVERKYSPEELAAIADEKGITGLRDIAAPLGIKGNSISGLIEAIMKAGEGVA
ncbi:hypothetical protein ACODYM_29240 [Burkholderia gladioli]|uniref:hypothetical protein n=1 Tax=Burkholderia gladioli TaxID=28095 RepID=UPI003B4FFB9E